MDIDKFKQEVIDDEHLRLLELFHYISGGITILFSSLFIFHLIFMSYFMMNPEIFPAEATSAGEINPEQLMGVFVFVFGFIVFLGISYGIAQIISGRFINKRKYRLFSIIVSIPNLLFMPFGTILAIFTIIALERKSIKEQYKKI